MKTKRCACHGIYPRWNSKGECRITVQHNKALENIKNDKPKKPIARKFVAKQKQKTPLRNKSKKQAKKDREYDKVRKAAAEIAAEEHGVVLCEIRIEGCMNVASDFHHPAGRLSGRLIEKGVWACRYCHDFVESHPEWAKEHEFSKSRLSK